MEQIKGFGLIICILMVLMAFLKQMLPRGKTMVIMRSIITVFIILSIVDGIRALDLESFGALLDSSYVADDEIWSKASDAVASGLLHEFENYLQDEGVQAKVLSVSVSGDQAGFEIGRVTISGTDAHTAKALISARYQVDARNIEVMYE